MKGDGWSETHQQTRSRNLNGKGFICGEKKGEVEKIESEHIQVNTGNPG